MSRSVRGGGTNVGAAPTTNNDDALLSQNDDDDENKLSIKVRSHDPVEGVRVFCQQDGEKIRFLRLDISLCCLYHRVFFPVL